MSEYRPEGGEIVQCPHCEDWWYVDDDTIEIPDDHPDYTEHDFLCECGEAFDEDWPTTEDPSEADVEAMFREGFSDAEWCKLTPTDKRSYYNDFTDGLCTAGEITEFMYENMSGHSEG